MPANVLETLLLKTQTIPFFNILINIVLAFLLGFFIAFIYRKTYRGYSYSASFLQTLILVTMITAVVIMLIGNNLARAFGLVGAMSIIRFRTALKDTWDMAFIFWSLALGLAAGSGNHTIGIAGGISIGSVIWILYRVHFGFMQHKELLLRFWMSIKQGEKPVYLHVFDKYLSHHSMLNVRGTPSSKFIELSFFVRLKKSDESQQLIQDLNALEGVDRVSLLVGENMPEN
jgi:uncharacterized membrane protein YhiD involved in acid resistance